MGRRKIPIQQITDPKLRLITFHKRKKGLIKKAAEMSLLCNVNLLLIFEDGFENLIQFSKNKFTNFNNFLKECNYSNVLELTANDYPDFKKMTRYRTHVAMAGQKIGGDYEEEMKDREIFIENEAEEENQHEYSSNASHKSKHNYPDSESSVSSDLGNTNLLHSRPKHSHKPKKHTRKEDKAKENQNIFNLSEQQAMSIKEEFQNRNLGVESEFNFMQTEQHPNFGNQALNRRNNLPMKERANIETSEMELFKQRSMEILKSSNQGSRSMMNPSLTTFQDPMRLGGGQVNPFNQMFAFNDVTNNQSKNLFGPGSNIFNLRGQDMMDNIPPRIDPITHMSNREREALEKLQNLYSNQTMNFARGFNEKDEEEMRNRMRIDGTSKIEEGETMVKDEEFFETHERYKPGEGNEQKEEHQDIPQMYFEMNRELKEEDELAAEQIQREGVKVEELSNRERSQEDNRGYEHEPTQTDIRGHKKLKKKVKKH
jgi:hypothetical protein